MKTKKMTIILPLAALMVSGGSVWAEEEEKPKPRQSRQDIIKKYDKNGDGKLDDAERQAARADFQRRGTQGQRPQGRPEGSRGAGSREDMIKKYDKNGDGTIDDAERQAAREEIMKQRGGSPQARPEGRGRGGFDRQAIIKEFDKNGDGKLNDTERQAAMTAMRERYQGQGRPPGRNPNARGSVDREAMVKKYDKNGDGVLDETERAAMRADFQKRSEQRRTRPEEKKAES